MAGHQQLRLSKTEKSESDLEIKSISENVRQNVNCCCCKWSSRKAKLMEESAMVRVNIVV